MLVVLGEGFCSLLVEDEGLFVARVLVDYFQRDGLDLFLAGVHLGWVSEGKGNCRSND